MAENDDLDIPFGQHLDQPEGSRELVPVVKPTLRETQSPVEIDPDPNIGGLQIERRVNKRREQDDATDRSFLDTFGRWGYLEPEEKDQWAADTEAYAKEAQGYWGSISSIAKRTKAATGYDRVSGPLPGIGGAGLGLLDFAERKGAEMQAFYQRRELLAKAVAEGRAALPKYSLARNIVEETLKAGGDTAGSAIKGWGRGAGYAADASYGMTSEEERRQQRARMSFAGGMIAPEKAPTYAQEIVKAAGYAFERDTGSAEKAAEFVHRLSGKTLEHFGGFISEKAKELFPGDEARQEEFATKFAAGTGSMITFWGTGLTAYFLTRAGPKTLIRTADETGGKWASEFAPEYMSKELAQKTAKNQAAAVSGATGAMMQGESAAQEAEFYRDELGRSVSQRDIMMTYLLNLPGGASEALPIAKLFANPTGSAIKNVIEQAIEEGGQEFGQQVLQNLIAQQYYDPSRTWDDGAWEGAAIGLMLGAGMESARAAYEKGKVQLGTREPATTGADGETVEGAPETEKAPKPGETLDGTEQPSSDAGGAAKPVREAKLGRKGVVTDVEPIPAGPEEDQPVAAMTQGAPQGEDLATDAADADLNEDFANLMGGAVSVEEIRAFGDGGDAVSVTGVPADQGGVEPSENLTENTGQIAGVGAEQGENSPELDGLRAELDGMKRKAQLIARAEAAGIELPDEVTDQPIETLRGSILNALANKDTARRQVLAGRSPIEDVSEVVTPDGSMKLKVKTELVELSDLTALKKQSDLQPRDRTTKESEAQVKNRAANMDVARLMPRRVSSGGAPIVMADGTVLSGNGRVLSLNEVYNNPELKAKADEYRAALPPEAAGMRAPVLITRIVDEPDRKQLARFADLSNRPGMGQLSASEKGLRDAKMAGEAIMGLYQGGSFTAPQNRDFYRAFLDNVIVASERGSVSREGMLTKEGEDRMSAAVLAAAYGDPQLLVRMLESTDDSIRSVTGAMRDAAGAVLRLKAAIASGEASPQFDITPQIVEVAKRIGDLRERGIKPAAFLAQLDAFTQLDPIVETLLRAFYNDNLARTLSREKLTEVITRYADEAAKHAEGGLIPDETRPQDIIVQAREKALVAERLAALQGDIFESRAGAAGRDTAGDGGAAAGQGTAAGGARPGTEIDDALKGAFVQILAGKAPRADWAAQLGVDEKTLGALEKWAISGGLLRQAANGQVRRTGAAKLQAAKPQAQQDVEQANDQLAERERAARAFMQTPEWLGAAAEVGVDTTQQPGYLTDEWKANRQYMAADGSIIRGYEAVIAHQYAKAKSEVKGGPRYEKKAYIVIGLPAAGKSGLSERIRDIQGAVIVDGDDFKPMIPEYGGGWNSSGVHEEASKLSKELLAEASLDGINLIVPKLGSSDASISRPAQVLRDHGYTVHLIYVDVPKAVAMERAIKRWRSTGRTVPLSIYDELRAGEVYGSLKTNGAVDEAAVIQWVEPSGWAVTDHTQNLAGLRGAISGDSAVGQPPVGGPSVDARPAGRAARGAGAAQEAARAPEPVNPRGNGGVSLAVSPGERIERAARGRRIAPALIDYATRLDAALGTPEFGPILAELKADKTVKKDDAVDVAGLILGTTLPRSTTKKAAFQSIERRNWSHVRTAQRLPHIGDVFSAVLELPAGVWAIKSRSNEFARNFDGSVIAFATKAEAEAYNNRRGSQLDDAHEMIESLFDDMTMYSAVLGAPRRRYYHGSKAAGVTQLDAARAGSNTPSPNTVLGAFLTSDKGFATAYGPNVTPFDVDLANPLTITAPKGYPPDPTAAIDDVVARALGKPINKLTREDFASWRDGLITKGHDGILVENPHKGIDNVVVFDAKKAKPATPTLASMVGEQAAAYPPGVQTFGPPPFDPGELQKVAGSKNGVSLLRGTKSYYFPHERFYWMMLEGQAEPVGYIGMNREGRDDGDAQENKPYAQRQGGRWMVDAVEVNKDFRGKGLAQSAYDLVEKDLGIKLAPSDALSDDGYKLWKKRDPAAIAGYQKLSGMWVPATTFAERVAAGKTIRAFHGMSGALEGGRFDVDRAGQNFGDDAGIFFTTDPREAGTWGESADFIPERGAAVVPADVTFHNPLRVSAAGHANGPADYWWNHKSYLLPQAHKGGHDGVIVTGNPGTGAMLVALSPNTVRSPLVPDLTLFSMMGPSPAELAGTSPLANPRSDTDPELVALLKEALGDDFIAAREDDGGAGAAGEDRAAAEGRSAAPADAGQGGQLDGSAASKKRPVPERVRFRAFDKVLGGKYAPEKVKARAKAQGFTVEGWHGTRAPQIDVPRVAPTYEQGDSSDFGFHVAIGRPNAANRIVGVKPGLFSKFLSALQGDSATANEQLYGGMGPANILPVRLNAHKPYRMVDIGRWDTAFQWEAALGDARFANTKLGKQPGTKKIFAVVLEHVERYNKRVGRNTASFDGEDFVAVNENGAWVKKPKTKAQQQVSVSDLNREFQRDLVAALEAEGYDSVIYANDIEDAGKDSMFVWDAARVRSAYDMFDERAIGKPGTLASKEFVDQDIRDALNAIALEEGLSGETLFSFIGDQGAKALALADRPAAQEAIALAEQLEADGADRDGIWDATVELLAAKDPELIGAFRGADGMWRVEAADTGFGLTPRAVGMMNDQWDVKSLGRFNKTFGYMPAPLGNFISHPTVFAAYPKLAARTAYLGTVDPESPTDGGGAQEVGADIEKYDYGIELLARSVAQLNSFNAHEIQHLIQFIEGFASGGNTRTAPAAFQRQITDVMLGGEATDPRFPHDLIDFNDLLASLRELKADGVDVRQHPFAKGASTILFQLYQRLAGEVEARNVQARLAMTVEERRAVPPWHTEDTPQAQQIPITQDERLGHAARQIAGVSSWDSEAMQEAAAKLRWFTLGKAVTAWFTLGLPPREATVSNVENVVDRAVEPQFTDPAPANDTAPALNDNDRVLLRLLPALESDPLRIAPVSQELARQLEAEIKKALPPEIGVRVVDRLRIAGHSALGASNAGQRILAVSLAQGIGVARETARHEIIHMARELHLFTEVEWQALVNEAKRQLVAQQITMRLADGQIVADMDAYRTAYRAQLEGLGYAGAPLEARLQEMLDQELVAKLAETFIDGARTGTPLDQLLERLSRFFEAVLNAWRGAGLISPRDVLSKTFSGELAQRAAAEARAKEAELLPPGLQELLDDVRLSGRGMPFPVTARGDFVAASMVGYHGSSADFEGFEWEKIGGGEGSTSYFTPGIHYFAYGHNFASAPNVAREYHRTFGRVVYDGRAHDPNNPAHRAADLLLQYNNDREAAIQAAIDEAAYQDQQRAQAPFLDRASRSWHGERARLAREAEAKLRHNAEAKLSKTGGVYEARLDVDAEALLDLDTPLARQSPRIQSFAKEVIDGAMKRLEAHGHKQTLEAIKDGTVNGFHLIRIMGGPIEAVSKQLDAAGIKGVRYADQYSEAAPGTPNYVVFDDKLITITAKNGKPVPEAARQRAIDGGSVPLGPGDVTFASYVAYHGTPNDWTPERRVRLADGKEIYVGLAEPLPPDATVIKEYPAGRVDLSKIGTGEGAQAYGPGFYAADKLGVAKSYYDTLSKRKRVRRAIVRLDGETSGEYADKRLEKMQAQLGKLPPYDAAEHQRWHTIAAEMAFLSADRAIAQPHYSLVPAVKRAMARGGGPKAYYPEALKGMVPVDSRQPLAVQAAAYLDGYSHLPNARAAALINQREQINAAVSALTPLGFSREDKIERAAIQARIERNRQLIQIIEAGGEAKGIPATEIIAKLTEFEKARDLTEAIAAHEAGDNPPDLRFDNATLRESGIAMLEEYESADAFIREHGYYDKHSVHALAAEEVRQLARDNRLTWEPLPDSKSGGLYKLDIKVDDSQILDWDLKISQQHPKVQAALKQANIVSPASGNWLQRILNAGRDDTPPAAKVIRDKQAMNPAGLRKALADNGIKVIRYLDGTSRAKGAGSYNYVVLDEEVVDVVAKNGEVVGDDFRKGLMQKARESALAASPMGAAFLAQVTAENPGASPFDWVQGAIQRANLEADRYERGTPAHQDAIGALASLRRVEATYLSGVLEMGGEPRLRRAEAQGFDTSTVYYHGTGAKFDRFNPAKQHRNSDAEYSAVFVTEDPKFADLFAEAAYAPSPQTGVPRTLALYVRTPQRADLTSEADLNRIAAALAARLSVARERETSVEDARQQLVQHIADGRLEWAYGFGVAAAQDAGFDAVPLHDSYGPSLAIFDPSNIRSVDAEFADGTENSDLLMASAVLDEQTLKGLDGLAAKIETGTPSSRAATKSGTKPGDVKALGDLIADIKDAIGMTATQGRYGFTVTDRTAGPEQNRPPRSWRFRPQSNLRGQYDMRAGVARYRLATDIEAIAHEGGHHLERLFGGDLRQVTDAHRRELLDYAARGAIPAAPDRPVPAMPETGYSGLDLDADAQRILVEASSAWSTLSAAQTLPAGSPVHQIATNKFGRYSEELAHRVGAQIAEALIQEVASKTLPNTRIDYVRQRFSATGTPRPAPKDLRTSMSEGFAEFFREYVTDPNRAARFAPGFYQAFEDFLDVEGPQLLEKIERLQIVTTAKEYEQYLQATTVDRGVADLVTNADYRWSAKWKALKETLADMGQAETISGKAAEIYAGAVDEVHPWYVAVKNLLLQRDENDADVHKRAVANAQKLGLPIPETPRAASLAVHENPYKLIRAIGDSFKTGLRWIQDGMPHYRRADGPRSASLWDALNLVMSGKWDNDAYQKFGVYLESRRAVEEWKLWEAKRVEMANLDRRIATARGQLSALREQRRKAEAMLERRSKATTGNEAVARELDRQLQKLITQEAGLVLALQEGQVATPGMQDGQVVRVHAQLADVRRQLNALEARRGDVLTRALGVEGDAATLSDQVDRLNEAILKRESAIEQASERRDELHNNGLQRAPHRVSQAEHEARIAALETENGNFGQAAEHVYAFLWATAVHDFEAGRLTQAELDYRKTRRHFYVPFARDLSDIIEERGFGGRSTTRRFQKDKAFAGSDRAIVNPIETIIDQMFHRAAATHFNDTVKALATLADNTGPGGNAIAERVEKSALLAANADGFAKLEGHLMSLGYSQEDAREMVKRVESDFGDTQLLLTWAPENMGAKRPLLLPLWENGERKFVRINDPEFAKAVHESVNGIGREMSGLIMDWAAAPATWLRLGITTNPTFVIPNIIRDMFAAFQITGSIMDPRTWPVITQARGLYHELRQTDMARLYQEVAGIMGGQNVAALSKVRDKMDVMQLQDRGLRIKPMRLLIAGGIGATAGFALAGPAGSLFGAFLGAGLHRAGKSGTNFWETMALFSDMSETATRLGVFTTAFDAAKSYNPQLTKFQAAQEAAYVARDLIDFGRRGSKMLAASRLVPFLNANIQGLDKTVRTLATARSDRGASLSPTKMAAAVAAGAGVGMAAGPIGAAVGAVVGPAVAAQFASRSEKVRRLLAPFYKRNSGLKLSRDEERALADSAKAWMNLLLYTAFLLSFRWLYDDDDEYKMIEPKLKYRAQPVKVGDEWGGIPKAFEWSIPATIIEAAIDAQLDSDPRLKERIIGALYENAVPPLPIPQGFTLWSDIRSNFDARRGRPIVPSFMQNRPPQEQYNAYSSKFAMWLARQINENAALKAGVEAQGRKLFGVDRFQVSPLLIDYAISTGGGYWGKDVQKLSNFAGEVGPRSGRVTEWPIIGTLLQRLSIDPYRANDAKEGYWKRMAQFGGTFMVAAGGYDSILKDRSQEAANQFLATLPEEERAFALVMAQEDTKKRRLHPFKRMADVYDATKDISQEIIAGRLEDTSVKSDPKRIVLAPDKAFEVLNALEQLQGIEMTNTMIALKIDQFAARKPLDTAPALALLQAASPAVAAELQERYKRKHVVDYADAVKEWPLIKDELMEEWEASMAGGNAALPNAKPRKMRLGGPPADPRGKWEDSGTTRRAPGADSQDWVDRLPAITGGRDRPSPMPVLPGQVTRDDDAGGVYHPDVMLDQQGQPTDEF